MASARPTAMDNQSGLLKHGIQVQHITIMQVIRPTICILVPAAAGANEQYLKFWRIWEHLGHIIKLAKTADCHGNCGHPVKEGRNVSRQRQGLEDVGLLSEYSILLDVWVREYRHRGEGNCFGGNGCRHCIIVPVVRQVRERIRKAEAAQAKNQGTFDAHGLIQLFNIRRPLEMARDKLGISCKLVLLHISNTTLPISNELPIIYLAPIAVHAESLLVIRLVTRTFSRLSPNKRQAST
mmetsp:Transcript_46124/g.121811  ORF Transcript_46124/g.121811 Transcript_46124/m.121811 type:complete len:238 (-) Transcript_46124:539-1252(-)